MPAVRASGTPETEAEREAPPRAEMRGAGRGGDAGPKTQKIEKREASPCASTEETTRASAPTEQPTAWSRPEARTQETARETSGGQKLRGGEW